MAENQPNPPASPRQRGRDASTGRTPRPRSAASSRRRHELTHVHSFHLDDASVYRDLHDEKTESEEDGDGYPEVPREADLEKGARREAQRNDSTSSSGSDASDTAHESASEFDKITEKQSPTQGDVPAKEPEVPQLKKSRSSKSIRDPNLVSWESADDPANPKNWTKKQKWFATLVVSSFTFISPVSSSMVAPSLETMAQEFGIRNQVESQLILSVFVLAYAVGPLFLGPLSEMYGRVVILQLSNLFFLVFNTACGASRTSGMLIAFRFLAGLGGSAPLAIGGGVLSDAWKADERGAAIAVYSLMPLIGPAVGPLAGGFVTQYSTWRWTFYAVSIADALIQLAGLFLLRETYPPAILHAKARRLRKETGNRALRTEYESADRALGKHLRTALVRPFRLLTTQPMVQVLALYMAYLYGLMYLLLSTFPLVWQGVYGESISIGSLNYISLGVGFSLGTQISARLQDRIYRALRDRRGERDPDTGAPAGKPEFRVPLMLPGSVLIPAGLFVYGWTADFRTHWIGPNVGAAVFSFGSIMCFQCIQTFLVDAYTRYAASAIAAATVLRSLAGFGFPLFAPYMYRALGLGWGNSMLGFVALALGLPAPVLLWFYGERLRANSPFAAGGGF